MECHNIISKNIILKPSWIVRWNVAYDPYSYNVRFEEWVGADNKVIRFTKIEPKMRNWECKVYEMDEGIEELTITLFVDRPKVVFATGKLPDKLKELFRRLPPSTYYLAVV
jgi:hypothetical protein